MVSLWGDYAGGVEEAKQAIARQGRRGKGPGTRAPRQPISHPQLGELYAGASDHRGHRTTISMPQDLADRASAWQAKLKGTPFDSHQGMIRHGLHVVLQMLDECDDVEMHPELKRWIQIDRAQAEAEQELRFTEAMTKLGSTVVQAMETAVDRNDAVALARQIGKAEGAMEMLAPKPRRMLQEKVDEYNRTLDAMLVKDKGDEGNGSGK